jgi:hypothetical protein
MPRAGVEPAHPVGQRILRKFDPSPKYAKRDREARLEFLITWRGHL